MSARVQGGQAAFQCVDRDKQIGYQDEKAAFVLHFGNTFEYAINIGPCPIGCFFKDPKDPF